jgi:hypothetical protein
MTTMQPTEKLKEINSIVNSIIGGYSTNTFSDKRKGFIRRKYWAISFNQGKSLINKIQKTFQQKDINDIKVYSIDGKVDSICLNIPFHYYI